MNTTAVFEEARKEQEMPTPAPAPATSTPQQAHTSAQASPFAQKELIKRECITIINKYKKIQHHGY